jgi:hypothetical protein
MIADVEDGVILQSVVPELEPASAAFERRAALLEVPELLQAAAQRLASGQLAQVGQRDGVLALDPGADLARLADVVLEPAVGVLDLVAVVAVDVRDLCGLGESGGAASCPLP